LAVVYAAQSQSLAALELLVHLDSEAVLQNYLAIPVSIPQHLMLRIQLADLPGNWAAYPAPIETRHFGDAWALERKSPVLEVPSAVIPSESNFLLNPEHPNFPDLIIGNPMNFKFDPRLSDSG
jgi:RES domain-containing protein